MHARFVPWEDWFSQPVIELAKSQVCPTSQEDYENTVYRAAHALGVEVKVHRRGDGGLTIEVLTPLPRNELLRLLQSRKPLLT